MIILFILATLAFCLSAICGGGAGLILMPLLGIFLPVNQLPVTLTIGTAVSSASRLYVFKKSVRWDIVRWFVPSAIPAVLFGAYLLKFVNPLYLEIIMGLFLVGNLPALFKKTDNTTTSVRSSKALLAAIGFMAGFLSGLTGAVGLLFNRFYLQYGLSKEEIVATRAANEITLHVIKLVLYALFGLISSKVILMGTTIAIAAIVSSVLMKWGIKKISEMIFRKIGYGAMVLSGIMMLSQSGNTLFAQNNAHLDFMPINGGVESKLKWQQSNLAIEFAFDEGFEYERQIPLSDLTPAQQDFVRGANETKATIVIEEVFGIGKHAYEAYYLDAEGKLVNKVDFN